VTVFVDTSVIMYAAGSDHPYRSSCQQVLAHISDARLDAVTSTEVVQEILHRFARGRRETGRLMAQGVLDLFGDLLPVDCPTIAGAVARFAGAPELSARDVLHVATCMVNGISEIVSLDSGFDVVTEVQRIAPSDLAGPR
jgi:predicted nucleic acid-binding protein